MRSHLCFPLTVDSPPETLENDFEALLAANNPTARLRGFSDSHIAHLASYAQMRMQRELVEGHSEVEAELQASLCEVSTDFRVSARLVTYVISEWYASWTHKTSGGTKCEWRC